MAAGKIQFYHEIMNTTIRMVSGSPCHGFPLHHLKVKCQKGGEKLYIVEDSGKGLYLGAEMERGAGMVAAPFNFYR